MYESREKNKKNSSMETRVQGEVSYDTYINKQRPEWYHNNNMPYTQTARISVSLVVVLALRTLFISEAVIIHSNNNTINNNKEWITRLLHGT